MDNSKVTTSYSDLFREIGLKIKRKADIRINELGLTSQQGRMLGYIYENQEKGVIQKDLADRYQLRGASISSMLQGLEEKGYIKRVRPEGNERQKNIYALEKCENLIAEFNEIFSKVEGSITKDLTEEEETLLKKLLFIVRDSL